MLPVGRRRKTVLLEKNDPCSRVLRRRVPAGGCLLDDVQESESDQYLLLFQWLSH